MSDIETEIKRQEIIREQIMDLISEFEEPKDSGMTIWEFAIGTLSDVKMQYYTNILTRIDKEKVDEYEEIIKKEILSTYKSEMRFIENWRNPPQ